MVPTTGKGRKRADRPKEPADSGFLRTVLLGQKEDHAGGSCIVTTQYPDGVILLVEVKTCHDTRPEEQAGKCHQQHQAWTRAAGRQLHQDQDDKGAQKDKPPTTTLLTTIVPIIVGVTGIIYTGHTLANLQKLGLDKGAARQCAIKLHQESADQLQAIICTRRKLEPKQQYHKTRKQTHRKQSQNPRPRRKPP